MEININNVNKRLRLCTNDDKNEKDNDSNFGISIQNKRILICDCTFRAAFYITLSANSLFNKKDWTFVFVQQKWINNVDGLEKEGIFFVKSKPIFIERNRDSEKNSNLERGFHDAFGLACYIFRQYLYGAIPIEAYKGHYVRLDHEVYPRLNSSVKSNNLHCSARNCNAFDFEFYTLLVSIFQFSDCFRDKDTKTFFFKNIHPIFMHGFRKEKIELFNIFEYADVPINQFYIDLDSVNKGKKPRHYAKSEYYFDDTNNITHKKETIKHYPHYTMFKQIYKESGIHPDRQRALDDYKAKKLTFTNEISIPFLCYGEIGNLDNAWKEFQNGLIIESNQLPNNNFSNESLSNFINNDYVQHQNTNDVNNECPIYISNTNVQKEINSEFNNSLNQIQESIKKLKRFVKNIETENHNHHLATNSTLSEMKNILNIEQSERQKISRIIPMIDKNIFNTNNTLKNHISQINRFVPYFNAVHQTQLPTNNF